MSAPFPPYSYLEEAAAEARAESRRHWAKGGAADTKYPVHKDVKRWWKIRRVDDREAQVEASIKRMRGDREK